jgi:hypothetical protein
MIERPIKREISIHENHTFDEDYCYECQRCLDPDEYPEDKITVGNTLYNKGIDAMSAWIEGVVPKKEELASFILEFYETYCADDAMDIPKLGEHLHTLLTQRLGGE